MFSKISAGSFSRGGRSKKRHQKLQQEQSNVEVPQPLKPLDKPPPVLETKEKPKTGKDKIRNRDKDKGRSHHAPAAPCREPLPPLPSKTTRPLPPEKCTESVKPLLVKSAKPPPNESAKPSPNSNVSKIGNTQGYQMAIARF